MDLRSYIISKTLEDSSCISEAVVNRNHMGNKKYGLDIDDIAVGVEIEEFTDMLDNMGFKEITKEQVGFGVNETMFSERGPVYKIVAISHNPVRLMVKVPKSEDEYFRIYFNEHTGKLESIQRVWKNKKVGQTKYLAATSDIIDLIRYLK
jgi:hypothetical protein